MPYLSCITCGVLGKESYCNTHKPKRRNYRPPNRYPAEYVANRAIILAGHPPCAICGYAGADTADHITPIAAGGSHHINNLRPAHKRCNIQRQDKP